MAKTPSRPPMSRAGGHISKPQVVYRGQVMTKLAPPSAKAAPVRSHARMATPVVAYADLAGLVSDLPPPVQKRLMESVRRYGKLSVVLDPERPEEALDIPVAPEPENAEARYERAVADAKARGATRIAEILADDDMLSSDAMGALLNVSRETVNAKRQKRELLGLTGATRFVRYPGWQVDGNGHVMPGLKALAAAFGGDPWSVYRFLVSPCAELDGEAPRHVLWQGEAGLARVMAAVDALAEGAFS